VKTTRAAKTAYHLTPLIILALSVLSCDGRVVLLAPPDWIQGAWQSDSSPGIEYVRWEFTASNAIYEYHDPANDIHSTVDLSIDFAGRTVTDDPEDDANRYEIQIELKGHDFYQETDETGAATDPSTLEYSTSAVGESWSWELLKQ
jgi:hypothetical protein